MYLKKVVFKNVRGFKDLDFDFTRPNGEFAGWTVFVGGNGSGKSTLLKAIALALMGPEAGLRLLGPSEAWSGWLRHGESQGSVNATIVWDRDKDQISPKGNSPTDEIELGVEWSQEPSDRFATYTASQSLKKSRAKTPPSRRGPWNPNNNGWFSAGYGPIRRLTGSSPDAMRDAASTGVVGRYVTLFREDAALSESELWLKDMKSRTLEGQASSAESKELLDGVCTMLQQGLLPHGLQVDDITRDHVYLKDQRGIVLPIRDISDGCRGVFALVVDLIHAMYSTYRGESLFTHDTAGHMVIDKPGVVIIDELEAHLHPVWQQEIPWWLKTHFPKLQFLVTTHSPLIAQAADEHGAFVLPLQGEQDRKARRLTGDEFNRLRLGRAEKVLLGSAFGLRSTRTQWANQQIEKWLKLNAKEKAGVPLKPDELKAKKQLHKQMQIAFEPGTEL